MHSYIFLRLRFDCLSYLKVSDFIHPKLEKLLKTSRVLFSIAFVSASAIMQPKNISIPVAIWINIIKLELVGHEKYFQYIALMSKQLGTPHHHDSEGLIERFSIAVEIVMVSILKPYIFHPNRSTVTCDNYVLVYWSDPTWRGGGTTCSTGVFCSVNCDPSVYLT